MSLAPRHPPPPAANPHPGWGEGDANYPGSGSARPPPPRPGPACARPRIPGLACTARPPGPPPSPGSAGRVTPPTGGGPRGGGLGTVTQPGGEGPRGGEGAGPRAAQPEAGTATGPRRGEPGCWPRPRAGWPRPSAAPRDRPSPIGSPARRSPPLLRTAPTRGPRRAAGAGHSGTCSPRRLPPAGCKRRGDYDAQRSPRPRPPTRTPHPFPLLSKAPSLFFQPPPPHPPWSSILANSNVCTQHRIGPRGARAPLVFSWKLSRRRAPLSPHAGSPHPQCSPASPPPLPARLGAPKSHAPGLGGAGAQAHALSPQSPLPGGAPSPRSGSRAPPASGQLPTTPSSETWGNVPGPPDLPFPRGQRWAQRPPLVPALHSVPGAAPGADLPRGAGPGRAGPGPGVGTGLPRPLASGVRGACSARVALPWSLPRAAAAASLPLQ